MEKKCNCERQIVWFFDKPTVIVCGECETAFWYGLTECPYCGGPFTYFEADRVESEFEEEAK